MKSTLLALTFCAAALLAPRAEAQFALLPYIGYNTEDPTGGFLVGIGAEFAAPFSAGSLALAIRPSAEYVFTDTEGIDFFQVNGDVIARFSGSPSLAPYAGAGLGVAIVSFDDDVDGGDDSNTELGLNLLGGVEFPGTLGFGTPFVQLRYSIIDPYEAFSVLGGFSIPLGQR